MWELFAVIGTIAFAISGASVTTLLFYFPSKVLPYWKKWGVLTDAIGLSAFAIQGALLAHTYHLPLPAMILAALLTGVGGGIVRDLLAKRQPFVLKYDLYAIWAIMGGMLVSIETLRTPVSLYSLFVLIILLRMISYTRGWSLPRPKKQAS